MKKVKIISSYGRVHKTYSGYQRYSKLQQARKAAQKWLEDGYDVVINKNDMWAGRHTGRYSWQLFLRRKTGIERRIHSRNRRRG